MKPGRNDPCPCGSGLKYKKCCYLKETRIQRSLFSSQKALNNSSWLMSLPFRAEIITNNKSPGKLKIGDAKKYINGVKQFELKQEYALNVNHHFPNQTDENERTENAKAGLTLDEQIGQINTFNNASVLPTVGNKVDFGKFSNYKLNIAHPTLHNKGLPVLNVSNNNLWVKVTIDFQRSSNFSYFDIKFGEKGKNEKDENGKTIRPHIALYPDGNGKLISYRSYNCEMERKSQYSIESQIFYPGSAHITLNDYSQKLILEFEFNEKDMEVTLTNARFEDLS